MTTFRTAVLIAITFVLGPAVSIASAESIDVGMPFSGKWAWPVPASPPYDDVGDSHPAAHHTPGGGDWATDLYAPAGTPVRLRLANATGAVSYSWASSSTSCGTSTRVNIAVDGVNVGWIYIAHLAGAVTSGPISNGMTLGIVANLACNPGAPVGKHVHIEVRAPTRYACYANHGQPGATTFADGTGIGTLGPMVSGPRQACPSVPAGNNPQGSFDEASSPTAGTLRARGWTFDPDAPTATGSIHVYVGGPAGAAGAEGYAFTANASRPDVGAAFPGVGDDHGLDVTFETGKRGAQQVCAYAINVAAGGDNVGLGCRTVTIAEPNPFGAYDSASSPLGGTVRVTGWSIDPNAATQPLARHVYVGGPAGTQGAEGQALTAARSRPDVAAAFPGTGTTHGLDETFTTAKRGSQQVCLYAINVGPGGNVGLGCKTVTIADPPPAAPPLAPGVLGGTPTVPAGTPTAPAGSVAGARAVKRTVRVRRADCTRRRLRLVGRHAKITAVKRLTGRSCRLTITTTATAGRSYDLLIRREHKRIRRRHAVTV
jgi:hypothetical protein